MSSTTTQTAPIQVAAIEAYCFRAPLESPLRVAFGVFRDRPSVLVRVVDKDGAEGWGEAWSNFPTVGAEHRARLVAEVVGPRLVGRSISHDETFRTLSRELEVLVLQTGEIGPIAQAIAGIDIAMWDLAARKAQMPLYHFLGGTPKERVPVYATGLSPDDPQELFARWYAGGHRAFKLKTGFGQERDIKNLSSLRKTIGDEATITIDSNQIHSTDEAISLSRAAEEYRVTWFEEAIRVDAPVAEWRKLASASPIPLAGGENLRGEEFERAINDRIFTYVQPDVTKWGGFSALRPITRNIVAAGLTYCPHYFGGGIALLSSLHLLAATGGDGILEFDPRDNPVRETVLGSLLPVANGSIPVPKGPGMGVVPDMKALASYRTWPR